MSDLMKCSVCGEMVEKMAYSENICSRECFLKDFWNEIVKKKERHIFVGGSAYLVKGSADLFGFKGFGGRMFYWKKNGEYYRSNDIWYRGIVPDDFKDRLPDNADFITFAEYKEGVSEDE